MFDLYVLGLVLLCSDLGGDCPYTVPGTYPAARFLVVNATEEKCSPGPCMTCGNQKVNHHVPLLIYDIDHVDSGPHPGTHDACVAVAESGSGQPGPDVRCWRPMGKKLCLRLESTTPPDPLKKQTQGSEVNNYSSIAALADYDNRYTKLKTQLGPGTQDPSVAWLDIPNAGLIEAHLVGSGQSPMSYVKWSRPGAANKNLLADAIHWHVPEALSSITIDDCATPQPTALLKLKPQSGLILVNLPTPVFDKPSSQVKDGKQHLYHFQLYYNLFKPIVDHGICGYPTYVGGPLKHVKTYDLGLLVRQESGQHGIRTADTALCPPSKFP